MIVFGSSDMTKAYVGSTEASKVYLGDKLVWGGSSPALPYDAEIKYLESSGTQYINTGYVPNNSTGVSIRFYASQVSVDRFIFGVRHDSNNTRFAINVASVLEYSWNTYESYSASYNNIWSTVTHNWKNSREGTFNGDVTRTAYPILANITYPLYLFAGNIYGTANYFFSGKVGSFQISQGDVIVMDLIPVRVGDVGYMYDKVSGELFGNSGTGSFTLGPDVEGAYDAEVEYLQSTGTQYIDTGVKPNVDTGIKIYAVSSDTADTYPIGMRNNSSNTRWSIGHSSNGYYYGYGVWSHLTNKIVTLEAEIQLNYMNNKKFAVTTSDAHSEDTLPTLSFTPSYNIRLFGAAGYRAAQWSGRLLNVQITHKYVIIMDLIPVRVGQIGYMYDKVSGELFGNSGTGSFTLGPDVS